MIFLDKICRKVKVKSVRETMPLLPLNVGQRLMAFIQCIAQLLPIDNTHLQVPITIKYNTLPHIKTNPVGSRLQYFPGRYLLQGVHENYGLIFNNLICVTDISDPAIAEQVMKTCLEKDDVYKCFQLLTGNGSVFAPGIYFYPWNCINVWEI